MYAYCTYSYAYTDITVSISTRIYSKLPIFKFISYLRILFTINIMFCNGYYNLHHKILILCSAC